MAKDNYMISLVNVMNDLDTRGKPIGHGLKFLRDFTRLIEQPVEILAGKEYMSAIKTKGQILPYSLYSGVKEKKNLKILRNYFISLKKAKGDMLIYAITNETLLWGIALYSGKRKIVLVTYDNWDKYQDNILRFKKIRSWMITKGLSKIAGCISTNKSYTPKVPYINIPDYYINADIMIAEEMQKKRGCICLGEMRCEKDIEGLVKCMNTTDIPLKIAGMFTYKKVFRKVRHLAKSNIKVINQNLPYDEYIKELSTYQYLVLPYNMDFYDKRTSGVLLEGIFAGAIPIAPYSFLKQNGIHGLGYEEIEEIPDLIYRYERGEIQVRNDLTEYQFDFVQKKVNSFIRKI